jgi:hypothetical protein
MFLLTDLTKTGYLQIKKDREILVQKIKGLETLLEEIDLALPFLQSIYEPTITIKRDEKRGFYIASSKIPYNGDPIRINITVAPITKFKSTNDKGLQELAHKKMMDKIISLFPIHFSVQP